MANDSSGLDFESMFDDVDLTGKATELSKSIGNTVGDLKTQTVDAVSFGSQAVRGGVAYVNDSVKSFTSVVSNFRSQALNQISSILQSLTGGFIDIKDIGNLIQFQDGKLSINTDSLMDKLTDQLGFDVSSMEALRRDLADKLTSQFEDITNGLFGELTNLSGTTLSFGINNWRNQEIQELIKTIDRITSGDTPYTNARDSALDGAFNDALLEQVVNNGMSDAYQDIYNRYPDEATAQAAVVRAIDYALNTGDYYSLKALTDLLIESSYSLVTFTYPTLPGRFLSNYLFDPKDHQSNYDVLSEDVKSLLTKLNKPNWWLAETDHGSLLDFTYASNLSSDAQTLFLLDKDLGVFIPAKNIFNQQSAKDAFTDYFPNAVLID